MQRMKFYNPVTLDVQFVQLYDKKHHYTPRSRLMQHMWSKGYVRAGLSVKHSEQEKQILTASEEGRKERAKKLHTFIFGEADKTQVQS